MKTTIEATGKVTMSKQELLDIAKDYLKENMGAKVKYSTYDPSEEQATFTIALEDTDFLVKGGKVKTLNNAASMSTMGTHKRPNYGIGPMIGSLFTHVGHRLAYEEIFERVRKFYPQCDHETMRKYILRKAMTKKVIIEAEPDIFEYKEDFIKD